MVEEKQGHAWCTMKFKFLLSWWIMTRNKFLGCWGLFRQQEAELLLAWFIWLWNITTTARGFILRVIWCCSRSFWARLAREVWSRVKGDWWEGTWNDAPSPVWGCNLRTNFAEWTENLHISPELTDHRRFHIWAEDKEGFTVIGFLNNTKNFSSTEFLKAIQNCVFLVWKYSFKAKNWA